MCVRSNSAQTELSTTHCGYVWLPSTDLCHRRGNTERFWLLSEESRKNTWIAATLRWKLQLSSQSARCTITELPTCVLMCLRHWVRTSVSTDLHWLEFFNPGYTRAFELMLSVLYKENW